MPQNTYSTGEVDQFIGQIQSQLTTLNNSYANLAARVTALEQGTTPPTPIPPQPVPGKFFAASSSWNTKLNNPTLHQEPMLNQGGGWINAGDYGVPLAIAQPGDPLVTINAPASWGWPAQVIQVHIKSGQGGATGTDGTLSVVDGAVGYDFWQFRRNSDTSATCSAWARCDPVNGSGWGQKNPFLAAGIHAAGSSCIAGLIRGNELTQGFSHALAIALRGNITSSAFVGEAIYSDGDGGPIPEGTRLAIPSNAPMTVTTTQGRMLWQALVQYGGFVIDQAGGNQAIYFWADPLTVPPNDINVLLGPNWTAAELQLIDNAIRVVS